MVLAGPQSTAKPTVLLAPCFHVLAVKDLTSLMWVRRGIQDVQLRGVFLHIKGV